MEETGSTSCPLNLVKAGFLRSRTGRPERRDAMEHRRRILAIARQLFTEHGVEAVNMHQIAQAAGVGQGTLYRRYANKGELCMDLLHERHERFAADIAAVLVQPGSSAALERLESVIAYFIELLEEQGPLLCPVVISEMHGLALHMEQELGKSLSNPFYIWLHGIVTGLLKEAIERGELAALDCIYTADTLLASLHPMLYRFQREDRGFSSEQIFQGLRRIYICGVKPETEGPEKITQEHQESER